MTKYEPVIGMEVHKEIKTRSKMFCSCANNPDEEEPNKNICPICMGHPGTLPAMNKKAVEYTIKTALEHCFTLRLFNVSRLSENRSKLLYHSKP